MKKLLFLNPVLNEGIQATVRLGKKWLDVGLEKGDRIQIAKTGCEDSIIATATVVSVTYGPFYSIPISALRFEHDPACHSYEGLVAEMRRVYSDFDEDHSDVTVIWFENCTKGNKDE